MRVLPGRSATFLQRIEDALAVTKDMIADATREKAVVKDKILLIMEQAIQGAVRRKKGKTDTVKPERVMPIEEDWMESEDEDYGITLTPHKSVVVTG